MPDGKPIGTLRLFARPEERPLDQRSWTSSSEWLGDLGIKSEVIAMESNRLTNKILDGEYDIFHWGWYVEADPDSILDVLHLRPARQLRTTRGTATRSTTP